MGSDLKSLANDKLGLLQARSLLGTTLQGERAMQVGELEPNADALRRGSLDSLHLRRGELQSPLAGIELKLIGVGVEPGVDRLRLVGFDSELFENSGHLPRKHRPSSTKALRIFPGNWY